MLWANDIEGSSLAKEKSHDDKTEMEYFDKGEKLLLEKGHWNGHAFEYTYRWPGDVEKKKHIKVTVDITIKDPSSEMGTFLQGVLDRTKNIHHSKKSEKHEEHPVFAAQQPTTIVKQAPNIVYASPPPPQVIIEERGPYYGPPVVGGLWLGGGWGHGYHHRHW